MQTQLACKLNCGGKFFIMNLSNCISMIPLNVPTPTPKPQVTFPLFTCCYLSDCIRRLAISGYLVFFLKAPVPGIMLLHENIHFHFSKKVFCPCGYRVRLVNMNPNGSKTQWQIKRTQNVLGFVLFLNPQDF